MAPHVCSAPPWQLVPADDLAVDALARSTGLSRVTARILVSRGVDTAEAAERFLSPTLERDWLAPSAVAGMDEAADAVADAVRSGDRIVVFGDFDLDGISAAAVASRGLRAMGADARAFVPRRFDEGYGLTDAAIDRMRALEPQLVVTVDCGISAAREVTSLQADGIRVVVTDHHEPGEGVPTGVPVADPKLDPDSPCEALAGAGVALKLVQAVGERLGRPEVWRTLTDLAALGTIADVVPLTGENRALVHEGVRAMREATRPGVVALAAVSGIDIGTITADTIAYTLAPRLNAAGRVADPAAALELLVTDDVTQAEQLAIALDEHNRVRQAAELDLANEARAQAEAVWKPGDRALVLAGDGWHEGVKGIVASRLATQWGLPTILLAVNGDEARGSGRSAGSVDLFAAVSACSNLLSRFGGHRHAVGLTLPADRVDEFRRALLDELAALPSSAFEVGADVDAELRLEQVSLELAAELERLAPFGAGNPVPRLASCGVFMNGRQRVGRANDHLRFSAFDGGVTLPAIAFRVRDIERLAEHDAAVDLRYGVEVDEWRGQRRLQLIVREVKERDAAPDGPAAALVEDLFAHADAILAREEYAGIEDAPSFHTKLAGVSFDGRQQLVAELVPGTPLRIERQPDNEHDPNACALVDPAGRMVGWFNRRLAAVLGPIIDSGAVFDVSVTDVTGGEADRSLGVNVLVERRDDQSAAADLESSRALRRAELASLDPASLDAELTRTFIGDRTLHPAQAEALAHLERGANTLVVMATGRGKSLIFHLHAARVALRGSGVSVFIYPLRALVADQAFHLGEAFAEAGLSVRTVTGETGLGERGAAFEAMRVGSLDVVLTTPEFFELHSSRFAETGRISFVVIDEAHHVGLARAGHRPSYGRLGEALSVVGAPTVLACTATAGDEVAASIRQTLRIDAVVLDPSVRENLRVVDERDRGDRDGYLASLVARGDKVVVYVNSREQSVRIARMLRKRVPDMASRTAFYNGGLSRPVRHAVERAFRDGDLRCVIATSAFGEGVNIPDIRSVVLYHLPFNATEFNQMCGRAGRDGQPAGVHLLFGAKDARINELILSSLSPARDDMAALYVVLRDLQRQHGPAFEITNAELAVLAREKRRQFSLDERGVSSALGILRELQLVTGEGHGAYRRLTLLDAPGIKVDLESSVRYAEGLEEIAEFAEFRSFALDSDPDTLLRTFNRPILPTHVAPSGATA